MYGSNDIIKTDRKGKKNIVKALTANLLFISDSVEILRKYVQIVME